MPFILPLLWHNCISWTINFFSIAHFVVIKLQMTSFRLRASQVLEGQQQQRCAMQQRSNNAGRTAGHRMFPTVEIGAKRGIMLTVKIFFSLRANIFQLLTDLL